MKTGYYTSLNSHGLHRLSYTEWGTPNARPLICVHGLGRNGRDFDALAKHLSSEGYWVICPDIAGRGKSDWLLNPADYRLEQYLHDLLALIARLNVEHVDWLGTSMGGLLGIVLSSYAHSPIKHLILNDIGPDISTKGLKRLKVSVNQHEQNFASLEIAERYFRRTLSGFGSLTDTVWRHLTKCSIKPTNTGGYTLRCDPTIHIPDFTEADQALLWTAWQGLRCPTLVIRGEHSDILLPDTLVKMKQHQRQLTIHEIPEVGHAPFLADPLQMTFISQWLSQRNGNSQGHR